MTCTPEKTQDNPSLESDLQEARARIGELEKELHEFSASGARIVLGTYKDLLTKAQARIQEIEKPVTESDANRAHSWALAWKEYDPYRAGVVASAIERLSLQVKEGRAALEQAAELIRTYPIEPVLSDKIGPEAFRQVAIRDDEIAAAVFALLPKG
jgi:hypothetical protein